MKNRFWENLSLGGKGLAVVAIPLVSLLVAVGLSYYVAVQPVTDELYVTRYLQRVQSATQKVQNVMQGAEAGVRGYLLTGVNSTLKRFRLGQRFLPEQLDELESPGGTGTRARPWILRSRSRGVPRPDEVVAGTR